MADTSAASLTSSYEGAPNVENYYVSPTGYTGNAFERIGDWFTGRDRAAEYEALQNMKYLQYQNDYNTWAENTYYQRRKADLEKAGLNPWLAVQDGLSGGTSIQSGSTSAAKMEKKSNPLSLLGSLLTSALKLGISVATLGIYSNVAKSAIAGNIAKASYYTRK